MITTIIKIIIRIIVFPLVGGIILIAAIRNCLSTWWLWLRYGGELMVHDETFNPETIRQQLRPTGRHSNFWVWGQVSLLWNRLMAYSPTISYLKGIEWSLFWFWLSSIVHLSAAIFFLLYSIYHHHERSNRLDKLSQQLQESSQLMKSLTE